MKKDKRIPIYKKIWCKIRYWQSLKDISDNELANCLSLSVEVLTATAAAISRRTGGRAFTGKPISFELSERSDVGVAHEVVSFKVNHHPFG